MGEKNVTIWTEADRLCVQCGAQVANVDDWLCNGCRNALEASWMRLMPSLPPSKRALQTSESKKQIYVR